MSQKQGKFNEDRQFRRDILFEEHEHQNIGQPIIFRSDIAERVAAERYRMKLMKKLANKSAEPSGDFGSYFYAPNKETDPVYSVTSHAINARSDQAHRSVVHTYPSLVQNLRWNPTVETASVHQFPTNERNLNDTQSFICRCRDCGSKHCRGQSIPNDIPRRLRDNITRFADNSTMTLKLNDMCCGSGTPETSSAKTSDVSVSGSNVAVRDNYCAMALSQVYLNCDPVSILKKTTQCEPVKDYEQDEYCNYTTQKENTCQIVDDFQEAVRDIEDNDYHELNKSRHIRSFPKVYRNKYRDNIDDNIQPRKNIYNEGISDLMVNCLPPVPPPICYERFQEKSLKLNLSKTSVSKKCGTKRDDTPFAHNAESKYHYGCKKPQAEFCYPPDKSVERLMMNIKKFKKTYTSKPVSYNNTQPIRYPRKVLTSERDIESYIEHRSRNGSMR